MPFAGHVSNVLFPLQGFVKPLLGPVSGNVTQGVFDLFVKLKIKSVQLKPFISLFPCCFPLAREGLVKVWRGDPSGYLSSSVLSL